MPDSFSNDTEAQIVKTTEGNGSKKSKKNLKNIKKKFLRYHIKKVRANYLIATEHAHSIAFN